MTTAKDWHNKGKYFHYKNHNIFYRDEGQGQALLCIHGFPTNSWDWYRIWPQLCSHYRVIAPDMIGFGYSDKPFNHNYSINDQADLLEALMAKLKISDVYVLAHDYGDTVAQELLARHNEQQSVAAIKALALLNGGLFPETHRPRLIQKLLMSPLGGVIAQFMSRRQFAKSFTAIFGEHSKPNEQELDEFWDIICFNSGTKVIPKLIYYMRERKKYRSRWVGALQHTSVPLRLINGPDDPISGLHMVKRYRELVPNPDVVIIETVGHYPQLENPQAVWEGIKELLMP